MTESNEIKVPTLKGGGIITEIKWEKREVIATDEIINQLFGDLLSVDKTNVKIIVKTKNIKDGTEAKLEIIQYSKEGNNTTYKKIEDLIVKNNELVTKEEKPVIIKFDWHDTIYEYKRTQYYIKVIIRTLEKTMDINSDTMIRLKHRNGILVNPKGDKASIALKGIKKVVKYLNEKGPWIDATTDTLKPDGHELDVIAHDNYRLTNSKGPVGIDDFKEFVEDDKFILHTMGHGGAYCPNCMKGYAESKVIGPFGSRLFWCPKCHDYHDASGYFMVNLEKGRTGRFEIDDIKSLKRAPKILVINNSCLTARSGNAPKAWISKGTKWYIGWSSKVQTPPCHYFSLAFYKRWFEYYKFDPDKVNQAFDDINDPYLKYGPSIYWDGK